MRFLVFVFCLVWFPLAAAHDEDTGVTGEPGFMTVFTEISNGSKNIELGLKSGERRATASAAQWRIIASYITDISLAARQRCVCGGDCELVVNQMKILASEPQVVRHCLGRMVCLHFKQYERFSQQIDVPRY